MSTADRHDHEDRDPAPPAPPKPPPTWGAPPPEDKLVASWRTAPPEDDPSAPLSAPVPPVVDEPSAAPRARRPMPPVPGARPPAGRPQGAAAAREREAAAEPPAPGTAFERPRAEPTPPGAGLRRKVRPGARVWAAVAAAAVLGAGAVAYLVRDEGGGGRTGGTTAARDAGAVFAAPPALYDGHEQVISGAAVRGGTAVTVGSETTDRTRGQILVSADGGQAWTAAPVRAEGGDPADVPRVVAAGARGWVALGDGPGGAVVWTSADGRSWTSRPGGRDAFADGDRVTAAAAASSSFAAAGTAKDGRPVVWTSADGIAWQRGAPSIAGRPERMAAAGDAFVVQDDKGDLWRSADAGRTWARAQVPQSDGSSGPVVGLAAGPGGFVAAREGRRTSGSSKHPKRRGLAVFFRSADGAAWSRSGTIDRRTYAKLAALGGSDTGLAALTPLTDGRLAVQRSADGASWQPVERLETDGGRRAEVTAALPKGVLVAGRRDNGAYLAAPGVRNGDVDLLAVPGAVTADRTVTRLVSVGGTILAVGSAGGEAAVWGTRDGASWTRGSGADLAGPGVQRLAAAAYGPRGWVAAGRGTRRTRPLLLTSPGGAAWSPAAAPSGDDGELSGAAYGGGGYVVVGVAGASGVAWRSDDLVRWTPGSGDLKDARLRDVTAVTGGYVAVGQGRGDAPTAWTSPDGARWTAVPLPPGAPSPARVVARGATVVAGGAGGAVAVSPDAGRTWRVQPVQAAGITAALATPRGFALAGTPAGTSDTGLWTSPDGTSWRPARPQGRGLSGDGDQHFTGLAELGGDLLATGADGTVPTLWRTPWPGTARP